MTMQTEPTAPADADKPWTVIVPLAPWQNYGVGTIPLAVHRLGDHVELRGAVCGGGRGAPVLVLPPDCRPPGLMRLPVGMPVDPVSRSQAAAVAVITASGRVTIETDGWSASEPYFDLGLVSFAVDVKLAETIAKATTGREGRR